MSLWSTVTSWIRPRAEITSDPQQPAAWLTTWANGGLTTAGMPVSPQGAMALSAYYDCIRIISEDVAKLPLMVYERLEPRGKRVAKDHPLYAMLHSAPNADMSSMTVRETMTHHMLGWGNGYAEILTDGRGDIAGLMPIHPARVQIRRDEQGRLVYDVWGGDVLVGSQPQGARRIRAEQMLHVHGLGPDGYSGYSVVQLAAESLGLSLAADHFGAAFFGGDATPSGILTHPQRLSEAAQKNLRESWEARHQGNRKMAILEEGMKWESLTIPPEQGQFIETREFQVLEICRWFRLSPDKLGYLRYSTYNNVEQQAINHVVDTLTPWLVRWEQEFCRKLFPQDSPYFAEHAVQGLLRGDQAARSQFYKELFGMAALSPNDIRNLENMNDIGTDGDFFFVAANNYKPLDQVVAPPAPEPDTETINPFAPTIPGRNGHREDD